MTTLLPRSRGANNPRGRERLSPRLYPAETTNKEFFESWRLPTIPQVAAIGAGIVFTLASATTNFTYAIAKTSDPTQQVVWGSVAIAASLLAALAPSAVLKSLQGRKWGAALASTLAALIFGGYSVVAALGSATGNRSFASLDAVDATRTRADAMATVDYKTRELASLEPSRTLNELQAAQDRLLASRKDLADCDGSWLKATEARAVCLEVQNVRAEVGRADRRARVESELAAARSTLASQHARSTVANTDTLALKGFAEVLGWNPSVDTLNKLLVVMSVLAIELGGGLAFAVAGSLGRGSAEASDASGKVETAEGLATSRDAQSIDYIDETEDVDVESCNGGNVTKLRVSADTATRLLELVQDKGGEVAGSSRTFGKALGISHTAAADALSTLEASGRVVVDRSKRGTVVRIAGVAAIKRLRLRLGSSHITGRRVECEQGRGAVTMPNPVDKAQLRPRGPWLP